MSTTVEGQRPALIQDSGSRERVYRVGISGSYGGLNLGDEAILQSIVTQLRGFGWMEITVFSRDAKDTLARHRVERAVAVRELSRDEVLPEVSSLDLFILGGGGILYDEGASVYLREVALAHEHGVPVLVSGTHEAHSSYRVMPIAMATGQAAGVCAALAARAGKAPRDVPAADVQTELARQGAVPAIPRP